MHTSVSNLVQHGKFHLEESDIKTSLFTAGTKARKLNHVKGKCLIFFFFLPQKTIIKVSHYVFYAGSSITEPNFYVLLVIELIG